MDRLNIGMDGIYRIKFSSGEKVILGLVLWDYGLILDLNSNKIQFHISCESWVEVLKSRASIYKIVKGY